MKRQWIHSLSVGLLLIAQSASAAPAPEAVRAEYRLKAAILFKFVLFTEWPASVGSTLNLCSVGDSPMDAELEALQGKSVGASRVAVVRFDKTHSLKDCHIVFIATDAMDGLPKIRETVRGRPVLTVADTPGAARKGVVLNLTVARNRISFEVNSRSAREAGLTLSSKLMRLAKSVYS